jgi:hypothetical protein
LTELSVGSDGADEVASVSVSSGIVCRALFIAERLVSADWAHRSSISASHASTHGGSNVWFVCDSEVMDVVSGSVSVGVGVDFAFAFAFVFDSTLVSVQSPSE